MATTIGQIESCQVRTRELSEEQVAVIRLLAHRLGDWSRMDFEPCDDPNFRRACRESAYAGAGEDLAAIVLDKRGTSAVQAEIDSRIDPRDRRQFRAAFATEIAAVEALAS